MKGSSEYCISHLLAPGAYARRPMVNRVDKLKIPIVFACEYSDVMTDPHLLQGESGDDADQSLLVP